MNIFPKTKLALLSLLATILGLGFSPALHAESPLDATLKGSWKSVCMDIGDSAYIKTIVSFDGAGGSHSRVVFFNDPACTQHSGLDKTDTKVKYSLGPKIGDQAGLELYPIDVTTLTWQLSQNGGIIQSGGALPTQYDVIAVKGDTLYMSGLDRSKKGPITSPAQRPTTLDMKNTYSRQK